MSSLERCPPRALWLMAVLAGLGFGGPAAAEPAAEEIIDSRRARFAVVSLAEGLEHPWGIAILPDKRLVISERPGRLRLVVEGRLDPRPIGGVPPVVARGQGGLLDVIAHPRFAETGWLYFAYSAAVDGGLTTRIGRGRLVGGALDAVETLFTAQPPGRGTEHFGSRLAFDGQGHLFFTVGERNQRDRAQDLGDDGGKVHRINEDGSIPADNPFVGRADASPSVWSYGHRNPQGLMVDPSSGRLWETEHGPRGGDELNLILPGRNYGWPLVTFGREYSGLAVGKGETAAPGLEAPVIHWTPSIAASGLARHDGAAFAPWRGNLFVGALVLTRLHRLEMDGARVVDQEILLDGTHGRIRDVAVDGEGLVYVLTDAENGALLRLEPR
ncbi:PQQ-dependent sugar dehydrogenase [Rhodospirillum rubrum]|uniref:Glucose/Sorbosone dehydrogenase domain-containing protein n=1 Tax=Rhodospirillum rubrum (strain ATCC 11170 / ATH 1.1.1 / DSM 467 / LMG 4362 / NCIMB 8255 / S1) TaxID=269796 RepID=Q2RRS6_RHORT|nr:PQQ-dependent sugar dehydrogenase [Rhodospirillum rubrum]ABC23169.1 conserved hypothetical protein [Rhodospirillum rubrum ATCC 11170]MBK5954803.1 hypothetical protein [Rhodospirillum rubrum]QXG79149.1 PQQ-dependent sugar dehydrogenase [Rhodospirillum rubrum]HAP99449.1 PQQ-dependent sugar dehydrogenase [Rhodospirillum rubrum]HCF18091.1 PQQ-dependent sugar dehydrogenase [Rhodospirillum rubrum]